MSAKRTPSNSNASRAGRRELLRVRHRDLDLLVDLGRPEMLHRRLAVEVERALCLPPEAPRLFRGLRSPLHAQRPAVDLRGVAAALVPVPSRQGGVHQGRHAASDSKKPARSRRRQTPSTSPCAIARPPTSSLAPSGFLPSSC